MFLLKNFFVNLIVWLITGLMVLSFFLWFFEKLVGVHVFLFSFFNIKKSFSWLVIFCAFPGFVDFFLIFYSPELGLYQDQFSYFIYLFLSIYFFFLMFFDNLFFSWLQTVGRSPLCDLFLLLALLFTFS